jgi:hypothetical protein
VRLCPANIRGIIGPDLIRLWKVGTLFTAYYYKIRDRRQCGCIGAFFEYESDDDLLDGRAILASEDNYWLNSGRLDLKASEWEVPRGAHGGDKVRGVEGADYTGGPRRTVPARTIGRSGRYAREIRVCPKRPGNGASKELHLCRS